MPEGTSICHLAILARLSQPDPLPYNGGLEGKCLLTWTLLRVGVIALSAAETGHLVLSMLHTVDATETINHMIDLFPPHERGQVRSMLAGTLRGIIGQRLVRTKDGGRTAACEVMVTTGRIQDFITYPAQMSQIQQAIAEGEYYGMQTFDQALLKLVEEDRV